MGQIAHQDGKTRTAMWRGVGTAWHVVATTLVLLSCSPRDKSEQSISSKTGNKAHDMLQELPEREQAIHLGNMIEEGCEGVRAFYMGMDKDRSAMWSVGCSNGSSYEVLIENDDEGSTVVSNCLVLKAMADVDCFATFASQNNRPPRTRKQFMCAVARLPPRVREQALRQFIQNLEDYIHESGEPIPNTREQVLKQFMQKLDREARSCDERSPTPSRAPPQPKRSERSHAKTETASSSQGSVEGSVMVPAPSDCAEFKAELMKLATCSSIPQATREAFLESYEATREAFLESYDHSSASQDRVPAEGVQALAKSCAASAVAVRETLASCHSASETRPKPTQPAGGSAGGGSADELLYLNRY